MYIVTLVHEDIVITNDVMPGNATMRQALRLAWELCGGIPCAECCVRRNGRLDRPCVDQTILTYLRP